MCGTAPDMQIDENLALARRRGQRRTLAWGITREEKTEYPVLLEELDLGPETRMESKVGLLPGSQRQALAVPMAQSPTPSSFFWTSTPRHWTPRLPPRCWASPRRSWRSATSPPHGDTQHARRHPPGHPPNHDGRSTIIHDVRGEEKAKLTAADPLQRFEGVSGGGLANDRMLLG